MASSLAMLSLCGAGFFIDAETLIPAEMSAAECIKSGELGIQVARDIDWRPGEILAATMAGRSLAAQHRYTEALLLTQRALEIAQEIEHHQWMCLAHRCLSYVYLDLLMLPAAQEHLEQALMLANKIGSLFHIAMNRGHLISIYVMQNELKQAEKLLHTALPPGLPMQTFTQRLRWQVRAELALAQRDPDLALQITDRLFAATVNLQHRDISAMPYLAKLRGEALTALRRWAEAEAMLQAALATAQAPWTPRLIWRIQLALGHLYQAQRRPAEAALAFATARQVIDELAATLPAPDLRDNFVRQAMALIPQPKPSSPLQTAKQTYSGLTRREREVAALIAQGKSNRAIAEALILGERTVEGYVANILAKLGFSARTQIAAWAVEMGLTKGDKMTG
jgi:DNA-binding CsgD family transcriptional regulator